MFDQCSKRNLALHSVDNVPLCDNNDADKTAPALYLTEVQVYCFSGQFTVEPHHVTFHSAGKKKKIPKQQPIVCNNKLFIYNFQTDKYVLVCVENNGYWSTTATT